jgi:ATP-dependent helicase/nuclease subunit A
MRGLGTTEGRMSALTPEAVLRRANEFQSKAAEPARSVWVVASAGTGKTTVLTERFLRLLLARFPAERLLCLTFTKAAAAEMANRIAERLAFWATMEEMMLVEALRKLLGRAATDEERELARSLFARVLDTPGGLRIMTIHAFCQSLLRRFPIEAGIAPHFALLDDRGSEELMAEARDAMLQAAGAEESSALADALAIASGKVNEQDFAELLGGLIRARGRIEALIQREGGLSALIAATRDALGLLPGEDEASFCAAGVADGAFDGPALQRAAAALARGKDTDRPRAEAIAAWLAAGPTTRVEGLDAYADVFLTEGKLRSRLATRDAVAVLPGLAEILEAEGRRLLDLLSRRRALRLAESTAALLTLGADMIARYQHLKELHVALDYEDLVLAAGRLLETPGIAPWVLFKLDGGIDHILVDEAQDTSPAQWKVIELLAEEFFVGESAVGEGVRPGPRTVFAVGDLKQSIFSFQGADPEAFLAMRRHFRRRLEDIRSNLEEVPLTISFRSTAAVLAAVDAIFARASAQAGVGLDGEPIAHQAARLGQAGHVELWPVAEPLPREPDPQWRPPRERRAGDSPRERLAKLIARRIKAMLERGERLESRGRAVRPGDFLILLRHRDELVDALVRELKSLEVPVAGIDRMRLTEQLAVMDLIAFGQFLLLPEDDFNLAVLLKSPLFGWNEEQLFALAHGRKGSLWEELRRHPEFAETQMLLAEFLGKADFLPPYELYAELLGRHGGKLKLLGRLGPEAGDPVSEFMGLALAYEREHLPSLQGFLHWLTRDEMEIKRESEPAGPGLVRIMTVHGAKGLQAPIVFLPDTLYRPNQPARLLWARPGPVELLLWSPRVEDDEDLAAAARSALKAKIAEEERRLLYVALTRAEDRLYICGWRGKNQPPDGTWYQLIRDGLAAVAAPMPFDSRPELGPEAGWQGEGLVLGQPQTAAPQPDVGRHRGTPPVASPREGWSLLPPPPEPLPLRPLTPSRLAEEPGVLAPLQGKADIRFRRGRLIHRLLQTLPDLPPGARAAAARRFLASRAPDLAPEIRQEMAAETLGLVAHPDFAPLFGPGSRAEAPLVGELDSGLALAGQIDRLLVTESEVLLVDFKTNRPAPRSPAETPEPYLRQMAAYRQALGKIYPGKSIRAALVWTEGPRLMELPGSLLDGYVP